MSQPWTELHAPPALPELFLRAALKRKVSGRTLPEGGLRCPVSVEARHLAAYRRVCAFADDGRLPPTYPHVMAFALQMRLLTADDFPFPLLGLVHLENRIRVLRPLGGLGPFRVGVRVADLQPHAKGALFSLLISVDDQLGPLWEGESRFLSRAAKVPGEPREAAPREALALAEVDHWRAPADIGRAYARVAGDYNPIHLSALSARLFGFPRAIAHGLWLEARSLAALGDRLPDAGYEVQVRFKKPLLLPGELTLLASTPGASGQLALRGAADLPHMDGEWSALA
ncbi:MaoC/PaaZ C-terminal domain-containing protein [Pseudomonas sp. PS02288]|uniref:MaoC family dehydratase n=1 Tax=Pseudomonas sp. PS02288 TaxID=2991443 RepID=UPI00249B1B1E|nr:MaoC/PaaZ C-terminal domain-containing protein [Pseudomonas sp. PS02288]